MKSWCAFSTIVFVHLYLGNCFRQTLYTYVPERCEATQVNTSLVANFSNKCYKLSRNELYQNLSFVPKVNITSDEDGQMLLIGYQLRSNVYRDGAIRFMLGTCSGLKSKDFDIPNLLSDSNFKCPILENHKYYINKVRPNSANFPPLIPEGRWKIELTVLYQNKYVMYVTSWYIKIEYPVPFLN